MNIPKPKIIAYQMLDVDRHLGIIIETAMRAQNPLGLIAVWYRDLHRRIDAAKTAGAFQHPQRVELLQWRFSNSYLNAYQCYQSGGTTSLAWRACFEARRLKGILPEQQLTLATIALVHYDLWLGALALHDKYPVEDWADDLQRVETLIWESYEAYVRIIQRVPNQRLAQYLGQLWQRQTLLQDLKQARSGWAWLGLWLHQPPEVQAQLLAEWDEDTLHLALQARHPNRWARLVAIGLLKLRPRSVRNLLKSLL